MGLAVLANKNQLVADNSSRIVAASHDTPQDGWQMNHSRKMLHSGRMMDHRKNGRMGHNRGWGMVRDGS